MRGLILPLFLLLASVMIVKPDKETIQRTCKATRYYDLCVSSLASDPASSTTDEKGLAAIMLGVGAANATATASFISSQMRSASKDTVLRKTLSECADKYAFARDALRAARQDLESEAYDYAYMHTMAAGDYPKACRSGFRRVPGLVYTAEMARREEALRQICDVVLGIIDRLISQVRA